mmetsp:Transcript_51833/g.168598  ORF Transcript_51833/g.168598 Transcript_51833/m.168598 type:complete len:458 (+) Transcript_51833:397-1770(+)
MRSSSDWGSRSACCTTRARVPRTTTEVARGHKEGFTKAKAALRALNDQLSNLSERNSNMRPELEIEKQAKVAAKADSEAVLAAVRALAQRLQLKAKRAKGGGPLQPPGVAAAAAGTVGTGSNVRDEVMRLASGQHPSELAQRILARGEGEERRGEGEEKRGEGEESRGESDEGGEARGGAAETEAASGEGDDSDREDGGDAERIWLVRRLLLLSKHMHHLDGLVEASGHLLKIVSRLLARHAPPVAADDAEASAAGAADADGERLFVAGDARASAPCSTLPSLRAMLGDLAASARHFDHLQREAIRIEGWPPPAEARRTRVLVDGSLGCGSCGGTFAKQWIVRGVCWSCEAQVRPGPLLPCPAPLPPPSLTIMETPLHVGATFCVHQGKCVVCDGGFAPCAACRLAQGDGEAAASLCQEWGRESVLFLDFDRRCAPPSKIPLALPCSLSLARALPRL